MHMRERDRQEGGTPLRQRPGFWRSPAGITLAAFLASAGLLLLFRHRGHLTSDWLLLLPLLLCAGMHFFMHRGHGRRGAGERHEGSNDAR